MDSLAKKTKIEMVIAICNFPKMPDEVRKRYENAYERRKELPYDFDKLLTPDFIYDVNNLVGELIVKISDENKLYPLIDFGMFLMYVYWKREQSQGEITQTEI